MAEVSERKTPPKNVILFSLVPTLLRGFVIEGRRKQGGKGGKLAGESFVFPFN